MLRVMSSLHPLHRLFLSAGLILAVSLPCRSVRADDQTLSESTSPTAIPSEKIENFFRLSPRFYSGGQPEGDAAFEQLEQFGVRTILSVDGARPDIERARKFGMRYVHIPIGYDSVPADKARLMAKAAAELPGPVYMHCHHGKHRGPAAAAFCLIATEGWSRDKGLEWMRRAGTSPDYAGLFQSVKTLPIPTKAELAALRAEFPETARVSTLVESMVKVDSHWDRLKEARARKYAAPPEGDLTPVQTALQLTELFREMARSEESAKRGTGFVETSRDAELAAEKFEQALRKLATSGAAPDREAAEVQFRALSQACTACHKKYRDAADRE